MLEPFGEQAKPGAIPIDNLDQVRSGAAPEHEQVAGERILAQHALYQHGEAIDALAHIDEAQGQVHLHVRREQACHGVSLSPSGATSLISTVTKAGGAS